MKVLLLVFITGVGLVTPSFGKRANCQDGEIVANDNNCYSYYICCNGELTEKCCEEGYYFNKLTKKCEKDVSHICWPNCKDGDVSENEHSCFSYYVCCNGKFQEEFCQEAYYFNLITKKCEIDVDNVCRPRCQDGEVTSKENCCYSYLECDKGVWKEELCNKGHYFNSNTKKCEKDVNNICWPKCNEGEITANGNVCYSYHVCHNGELEEKFCEKNYYFNSQTKKCEKDVSHTCWPAEECQEGEVTATLSCSSYRQCQSGSWKEEFCNKGYYFNSKTKKCEKDVNNICWPKCNEGEITANGNVCYSYHVCHNGELQENFCEKDYYFNSQTKKCEKDVSHTCWPAEECQEGDVTATLSCFSYRQCQSGSWKEEFCNKGYYFNSNTKKCEKDVNNICWPKCNEGEITANGNVCHSYHVCLNGELEEKFCEKNYYFNSQTKKCEKDVSHTCWPAEECQEGDVTATLSCSSYLQCQSGSWKEEFCNKGYYFNSNTKKCESDVDNICWPKCNEGEVTANGNVCYSYHVCLNGELEEKFCEKNYYFNSQTKKCEKDVSHTCWPAEECQEGEVTATLSCSSYRQCQSGSWKEEFCNKGYYFNSNTKKCEKDVNNICWPKCNEGEITANGNVCYSYHVCHNGELQENFCEKNYYFNSQTKKCEKDVSHTCWPAEECQEGDVTATLSCSSYRHCQSGSWKEEFCNKGYYFNSNTKKCEKDVNNICWPKCNEGEITANGNVCYSYHVCHNGELEEKFCEKDYYFNSQTKKCEKDVSHSCWPAEECQEGEVTATLSCSSYRHCQSGSWKEEFCNKGYYFNSNTKKCEKDVNNICWPKCNEGEITANGNVCYSYHVCHNGELEEKFCEKDYYFNSQTKKCEKDVSHTCWPAEECQEGDVTATLSCSSYLQCKSGSWKEEFCNKGYYFNSNTKKCEKDVNNICWPKCNEGEITANGNVCYSYHVCHNGELEEKFCEKNYYFNSQTKKCEKDVSHTCWPAEECQEGDVTATLSCSSYRQCQSGSWKEEFCNKGYYFNSNTKKCEKDVNNICWPKCNEGEITANGNVCYSYHVCHNGELEEKFCEKDYYFNSQTKKCEKDVSHTCWPAEECQEGDVTATLSCSSYRHCQSGSWKEEFCNKGYYFNSNTKKCEKDVNNICWPKCNEGEITANGNVCYSYHVCHNGELEEKFCEKNYYFNSQTKKCEKDVSHSCWPAEECQEGEVTATLSCSSYRHCQSGSWKEEFCNKGYYFNSNTKKCEKDVNNICWPKCNEGEITANGNVCYSYHVCHNGELEEKFCEKDYYFNSQTKKCEKDVSHSCWPAEECQEGDVTATLSCSSYLQCKSGSWKEEFCNKGYYFNSNTKKCESDVDNICWPKCNEGEITANGNVCYSYHVCHNGELEEKFCEKDYYFNSQTKKCEKDVSHSCWPAEECQEGDVTATLSCSSYLQCKSGSWKEEFCSKGYYFNSNTKKCESDVDNICWPKCNEGEITANGNVCYSYHVCHNGELEEKFCEKDYYFNSQTKKCEKDVSHSCWPAEECQEGEVTATLSCYSYRHCQSGSWKEEFCNKGYYFNSNTKKCEKDVNNICWPKCNEGEITANGNVCYSYHVCHNGELEEKFCEKDYYFNSQTKKCEKDVSHSCWPAEECQEGDVTATLSCSSYLQCKSGSWKEEFCSKGYYFNSNTKKCESDVDNICWPKCNEGEITANGNVCYSYHVCHNGELEEKFCEKDYYFNSQTKKCEKDVSHTCWPAEECQEGDVTATLSCSSYLQCKSGSWKEEFCNKGYYFNSNTKKCEKDVNNICWPKCNEGEITVNGNVCYSYHVCHNGELEEKFCEKNYYFNSQTKKCEKDVSHTCWPAEECQDGDVTATLSCSSYRQCQSGSWKEEFCNKGYYFNSNTKKCEKDVNNICWPKCNEGEITANGNVCYSYHVCHNGELQENFCEKNYYFNSQTKKCEKDVSHTCWPAEECQEGDVTATLSCSSYRQCQSGSWKEEFCNKGYYFNSNTKKCEKDVNNICWPKCNEGEITANGNVCYSYHVCHNGELEEKFCEKDYYFNSQTKKCEKDVSHTCWPAEECQEGDVTATLSCSSYRQCQSGSWKEEFCNKGYYFNSNTKKCEKDVNNICWPKCNEGEITANGNVCYSYHVCHNGELEEKFCEKNYYFNSQTKKCEKDVSHTCWPAEECQEGDVTATLSCSSYRQCQSGSWKEEFCNKGYYFNSNTKKCEKDVNNICWPKCNEGEITANGNVCYSFHVCLNGELQENFCEKDYYFNSQTKKCEKDVSHTCWPAEECQEGDVTATLSCSSYRQCQSGSWKEEFCNKGYYFNSNNKKCEKDVNNICWPKCNEGEITANGNVCYSYHVCHNGELQENFCEKDYYFNSQTKKCEEDVSHTCWPAEECQEGDVTATLSCSSYRQCQSGSWKEEFCNKGYYFNSNTKKCEKDVNNICWPKCNEGEITANGNVCYSYHVCHNGELEEEFCEKDYYFNSQTKKCEKDASHTCWPVRVCEEGEITASNSCSSYLHCLNGAWNEKFCNEGYYFNSKTMNCERDVHNICSSGCKDGEITANDKTCYAYYVCYNSELKEEFCEKGYYFNSQTKKCEKDVLHTCWPVCEEGEVSAGNSCFSYLQCNNGSWNEESCNIGYYFNANTKQCEKDVDNICLPKCKDGEIVSNDKICYAYYVCYNGELKEEFCEKDYYFNIQTNKCEKDVSHTCWPVQECEDGDISASNSCASYLQCKHGFWNEEFCAEGYYFNAGTKQCEKDVSNICRPQCKEGEITANDNICYAYYVCSNGELKEEFCEKDYYFNSQTRKCEKDVSHICWPTHACEDGEISASNSCDSYLECDNGSWEEKSCNVGYYFNADTMQCEKDVNNICRPKCKDGEITANDKTCYSYYVCCSGELKEKFCENGYYFNIYTKKCEKDVDNTCHPRCKDGEITANDNNCYSYYVCCNGQMKEKCCEKGYYFDQQTKKCEEDVSHTCWPSCQNGQLSLGDTCASYLKCDNGNWNEYHCSEGYYFKLQSRKCETDTEGICWQTENDSICRDKLNGKPLPGSNCQQFVVCTGGTPNTFYCPNGLHFNAKTGVCDFPEKAKCDVNYNSALATLRV